LLALLAGIDLTALTALTALWGCVGVFLAGFMVVRIPQEIGKIVCTEVLAGVVGLEIRHDFPH
jgi:hypothetical protein